jgi:hypothetical protein
VSDMHVGFSAYVRPGVLLSEDRLTRLAVDLTPLSLLKGQLRLAADGEDLEIEDELVPLVLGLCFRAPIELSRSDHATVAFANWYGYLRLDREGDLIRISGDEVRLTRFRENELIPALIACGGRFADWARRSPLPGENPTALEAELDTAQQTAKDSWGR